MDVEYKIKPMGELLTEAEKNFIVSNYVDILDNMKIDELILKLLTKSHMTRTEKSDLKGKTDNEKAQYIVDEVFLKSTYPQLSEIRDILISSKIASHIAIAKTFPTRGEKINFGGDDTGAMGSPYPSTGCMDSVKSETVRQSSSPIDITKTSNPVEEDNSKIAFSLDARTRSCSPASTRQSCGSSVEGPDKVFTFSEVDQAQEFSAPYEAAGLLSGIKSMTTKRKSTPQSEVKHSKSAPQLQNIPSLGQYGVKESNDPVYGESLCVVMCNFTGDLCGYKKDVIEIVNFHKNYLRCKHILTGSLPSAPQQDPQPLENLSKDEFMKVLKLIQDLLVNPFSLGNKIDRFFLYILSHGDKHGINTCKAGSDTEREENDENGKPIRINMQCIIDMFSHDKVPFLKGFPKIIFQQTCQGTIPLKAAHPSDNSIPIHPDRSRLWEPPKQKLAVGADMAVCTATSTQNLSWVSHQGSVFIQHAMQVMKQYYTTEHFLDMMTEVNKRVAYDIKRGEDPRSKKTIVALQMPVVHHTLTEKFYLAIQSHRRSSDKSEFYCNSDNV